MRLTNKPWQEKTAVVLMNPRLPEKERARIHLALSSLRREEPGVWVSTSGSTVAPGVSKWVLLTRNALIASAAGVNTHLGASRADTWIHALPEFHVGGVGILVRAEISGSRLIDGLKEAAWNPAYFHQTCQQERATLSALVPAQVHDLVRAGLTAPANLRAIVIGGGALPDSLYQEALALGWPLLPSYGLSECASQVATAGPDSSKLFLLTHVKAETDADGRLKIKSDALFDGYGFIAGTRATWLNPKNDGWFTTEDRAEVRMNNTLKVFGRAADFVKIGGESVDLARLEALLNQIVDGRGDATLIAAPDPRLGHVLQIVLGPSMPEPESIQRKFNESVLPFERAKKTVVLSDAFPRSPLGKILRAQLSVLVSQSKS